MLLILFGMIYSSPKYKLTGTTLTVSGTEKITQENLQNANIGNLKLITVIDIQNNISAIGDWALNDCTGTINIIIADSVQTISTNAFYRCNSMVSFSVSKNNKHFINDENGALISYNGQKLYRVPSTLTKYTFPASVTNVLMFCFEGSNIKNLVISRYVVSLDYASLGPSNIANITFESNSLLKELRSSALRFMNLELLRLPKNLELIDVDTHSLIYQSSIKSIEFEDDCKLNKINKNFIDGCSLVTKIKFPKMLSSLQANIINNCDRLIEINIPKMCTFYDPSALVNCPNLAFITVDQGNTKYVFDSGIVTDILGTEFVFFPSTISNLKIGPNFSQISNGLIQGAKNLTRLNIDPNNKYFNSSNDGILYNYTKEVIIGICGGIKSITINSRVREIKENAGLNCDNLESVLIEDGLTTISTQCFMGCTSLSSVSFPKTLRVLKKGAFQGCKKLQQIPSINDTNLYEVGQNCFYGAGLTSLVLPNTINLTGISSFRYNNLNSLIINCAEDCIFHERSFSNNPLVSVTLSENVTQIGSYMFHTCKSLSSINFLTKSGIKKIDSYGFCQCGFIDLVLPNTITHISIESFSMNMNLKTVKFQEGCSLESLGSSIFINCPNLDRVIIPPSVSSVDFSAFQNDEKLVNFEIESSDTFSVVNGSLHNKEKNSFILCAPGKKNVTIGDTITSISPTAFYYCFVEHLEIASPITEISSSAFIGCKGLTTVCFISKNIKTIGEAAFDGCQSLQTINLHDLTSLKEINSSAFSKCSSLKNITLPHSITSIGKSLFTQCTTLQSVDFLFAVKEIPESMFDGCSVFVPIIPSTVNSVGKFAYRGTKGTSVDIPPSVQTIGENAFHNINGLIYIKYCQETAPTDNGIIIASEGVNAYVVPGYPRGASFHGLKTMYVLKPDCSLMPPTATRSFHFTAAGGSESGDLGFIISAQVLTRENDE